MRVCVRACVRACVRVCVCVCVCVCTACAQSTVGLPLQTRGYVAPELQADPQRPKSRASDVYALGLSIDHLLSCLIGCVSDTEVLPLKSLVADMIRNEPADRTSALEAEQSAVFQIQSSVAIVSPKAPPAYWAKQQRYTWIRSSYMEQQVASLLNETTCDACKPYGLATNVRVV